MARKPVLAVLEERIAEDMPGELTVICDDGTVWGYSHRDGAWYDYPPIPGTAADPDAPKPQRPRVTAN